MFVDKFMRVECQSCGASFSIVEGSMDEQKYDVSFCPYCGEEDIDFEVVETMVDE